MIIRKYEEKDIKKMIEIWNEVVEDGIAFPQEDLLDDVSGREFFESQSYTGVVKTMLYKKVVTLPEEKKTAEVKAMIETYNKQDNRLRQSVFMEEA